MQRFEVTVTPSVRSQSFAAAGFSPVAALAAGTNVEASLTSVTKANGLFSFQVTGRSGGQYVVQEPPI